MIQTESELGIADNSGARHTKRPSPKRASDERCSCPY